MYAFARRGKALRSAARMALIPPAEERRKVGTGPSPYFSSVLGLFGGILAWQYASFAIQRPYLLPLLPPPAADGTWTLEQMDAAQRALAAQPNGPLVFLAPQLAFVLVACLLAFLSRVSFVDRLALRPSRIDLRTLLLLGCGMLGVQGLVISCMPFLGQPSSQLEFLNDVVSEPEGTRAIWIGLAMALVPAFCEELFFRGLVQSRLSAIWPPGAAILLCSAVFAMVHYDPQHMLLVLPIGLYLGWAAWRGGSVWLSMLLHALNNLAAVLLGRVEVPMAAVYAGTLVLGLLGYQGARELSRTAFAAETTRRSLEGLK